MTIALLALLACLPAVAQRPSVMLDKCVAALNAAGGVTASYTFTAASGGTSSGTIAMQGRRFRVLSPEIKCWYDGSTQWAWSPVTGEVNVTTPTAQELQMTNPMVAAQSFKQNFTMKQAKARTANTYVIKLTPKKKDNIKVLWLYFDTTTSMLRTARFEMQDGTVNKVQIKNYKTGQQLPTSVFTLDKSQLPAGTTIVDLR